MCTFLFSSRLQMKLDYDQWVSMLSTDQELKKNKVDKLWNTVVWRNKEISEALFNLLYVNKNLSFEYRDIVVPITISEEKTKNWNKRYYLNYKTHLLIREKIPVLKKQWHITSETADKIKEILEWMKYCEKALDTKKVASNPLEVKPTQEVIKEKHNYTGTQLTISFDEGKKKEDSTNEKASEQSDQRPEKNVLSKEDLPGYEKNEGKKFSDDELDDIYSKDKDEPWWNR